MGSDTIVKAAMGSDPTVKAAMGSDTIVTIAKQMGSDPMATSLLAMVAIGSDPIEHSMAASVSFLVKESGRLKF